MRRIFPVPAFVLLLLLFLPFAASAADSRCESAIVSVGDTSAVLLSKCGEPDWKQSQTEEIIETTADNTIKRKVIMLKEEWTYNFGPDRFMRIVTLREGKVMDVRSGGYGTAKEEQGRPQRCGGRIISVGDSAADVLAKCGEPDWKDRREEVIQEQVDDNTKRRVSAPVEDWTYNFGPDQFLRVFTFRNGKVTDVRTGGYGYETKSK